MSATNGKPAAEGPTLNAEQLAQVRRQLQNFVVQNIYSLRTDLARQLADPRRDVDDECGRPRLADQVKPELYQQLYDRHPVAARVVEMEPNECWQVTPAVYEDDNPDAETEFEAAWAGLHRSLRGEQSHFQGGEGSPLWEALNRADVLSGVGRYGVLLLGLDDGQDLSTPAAGVSERGSAPVGKAVVNGQESPVSTPVTPGYGLTVNAAARGRKLLYLRVFPESLAQVVQWEGNWTSPRFGQPVMYLVTFNDPRNQALGAGVPASAQMVHWTRCLHLADNLGSSETVGRSRMQQDLDDLLELRKILGADGECFWRNAVMKLFLSTHPQLGGDVDIDRSQVTDDMEKMMNSLQQWMLLVGMDVKPIAPAVVDPTPHFDVHVTAICVRHGFPKRVFMGTERGQLASGQDDAAWNDRVRRRQNNYLTPRVVVPLIDRLILLGVLPAPKAGYSVSWPDLAAQTDDEKADVALKRSQALAQYVSSGAEAVMAPLDFLTRLLGLEEDEAQAVLENATAGLAEREAETETEAPAEGDMNNGSGQSEGEGVLPASAGAGERHPAGQPSS